MARQTAGYYPSPPPQNSQFTSDWYKQNMPSDVAKSQSGALGISEDQLHQLYSAYAQANPGQRATWEPTYTNPQQTYTPGGGSGGGGGGTVQSAPPAWNWIQQQVNANKAQQILNPQVPQQAQQPQMPQLGPAQPMPKIPITPLASAAQYGASTAQAPTMNVPQANAGAAAPLFSLGGGQNQNWMLPQAQAQPVQKFQGGGPVQSSDQPDRGYQVGDPNAGWNNPLYAASALGAAAYGPYTPMVINPTPSGQPSSKSGVAAVGQPTVYQQPGYAGGPITLPSGQTFSAEQVAAFSPADWAEVGKVGIQRPMPSQQLQGPWNVVPSVFRQAPMPTVGATQAAGWTGNPQMPLTAQTPANAAQMPQMNVTPAANAAAAVPQQMPPGANVAAAQGPSTDRVPAVLTPGEFVMNRGATQMFGPQLAQMNQMAGQPPAAPGIAQVTAGQVSGQPEPYTGTVHTDPFMSHAVSTLMGLGSNPWHGFNPHTSSGPAVQGATTALATGPVPAKKMQSGGYVTPNWDQQQQIQRFQGGGLSGPMGAPSGYFLNPATGSYEPLQETGTELAPITVTGTPPQRPRQITRSQQQPARPPQQPTASQVTQPQPQYYQSFGYGSGYPGSSRPSPTQPQPTQPMPPTMPMSALGTSAYQSPAAAAWNAGAGGSSSALTGFSGQPLVGSGGGMTVGQLGSGPMPGAGQTISLGKAPTTMGGGIQAAGQAVASGLQQAASAIASSVHPWQPIASAIPSPAYFQQQEWQQQPQLQQPRVV